MENDKKGMSKLEKRKHVKNLRLNNLWSFNHKSSSNEFRVAKKFGGTIAADSVTLVLYRKGLFSMHIISGIRHGLESNRTRKEAKRESKILRKDAKLINKKDKKLITFSVSFILLFIYFLCSSSVLFSRVIFPVSESIFSSGSERLNSSIIFFISPINI